MAYKVEVAQSANSALWDAVDYIVNTYGEHKSAKSLVDKFDSFIDNVSDFPKCYPICADKNLAEAKTRKALINNYVALYKIENDTVYVTGFFHQRQDYAKLV